MLDQVDLDRLDELYGRATPPPWINCHGAVITDDDDPERSRGSAEKAWVCEPGRGADADLIAELVNAYPALAAKVRQATIIRAKSGNALADDLRALVEATCELGLLPWCDSAHWIRAADHIDEQAKRIRELEAGVRLSETRRAFGIGSLGEDVLPDPRDARIRELEAQVAFGKELCRVRDANLRELEAEVERLRNPPAFVHKLYSLEGHAPLCPGRPGWKGICTCGADGLR